MEDISHNPIEPGWDYRKEEGLVKRIEQTERQYVPIEPKSGFPNPYRKLLKKIIEIDGEEANPKNIFKSLGLNLSLFLAPGGALYFRNNVNKIKREVCLQKGKKLVETEFDKEFNATIYMIEITKLPMAYFGSFLASKLIF